MCAVLVDDSTEVIGSAAASAERDRTLVIIPALNEREALPRVLETLRAAVPNFDVLVVDDGSTDGTADVARDAGVMVAQLPYNLGIGGAIRTGFRYAVRQKYDRAVQFDADGQHDVSQLKKLIVELDRGADMVIGSRFGTTDSKYQTGIVRGGAMGLLRVVVSVMAGRRFTDTSSGFRAYSKRMLEYFSRNWPLDYLSDAVESILLASYSGFNVVEVPVMMHRRAGGQPSNRSVRLAYHYFRVFLVLVTMAPTRRQRRRSRQSVA